ncbi:MAG: AraC family transcriptional regulator [Eubacteriales bacterium]
MRTLYTDLNIQFTIEEITFSTLNIVYENFERVIPEHSHGSTSYEIHYIPYGKGRVSLDNKLYDVTPNTLYVTGPHVKHAQFPDPQDPMIEYCIYFKITKKASKSFPKLANNTNTSFISLFEETTLWFGQDTQDIHPLMQQIFHELENEYSGYMTQVETLLSQFVVKVIRNYKHRSESRKHFAPSNLVDSKYIIVEESFLYEHHNLTLEKLASRLGLGTRQTERFIKDCYGKTFLQKKIESNMAMAALKLSDTQDTITRISEDLGYSSIEHFSHAFKKYYGITARQYRKEHQK